jgi:pimeloyl-ACP methyl ester carboxylesterase
LVFEACGADATCDDRFPELEGRFGEVLERLREAPPQVRYVDSTIPLNAKTFLALVFTLLYQKESTQLVPALIGLTWEGDLGAVESLLPALAAYGSGIGEGAYYSVECTDEGQRPATPTTSLMPLPAIGDDMPYAQQLVDICWSWPAAPASEADIQPVASTVPTLLLTGTFDPITPPEYAHLAASSLTNATVVEFADQGHIEMVSGPCSATLASAFLSDPLQVLDASCAAGGELKFLLP